LQLERRLRERAVSRRSLRLAVGHWLRLGHERVATGRRHGAVCAQLASDVRVAIELALTLD